MSIAFKTLVNGPFQENCYLVWDEDTMEGIFVDPGDEPERLMQTADSIGVKITGIFNTHGHIDHAGGVTEIVEKLNVPFAIHPADTSLLSSLPMQAAMFGISKELQTPSINRELKDGDSIMVGKMEGKVLFTPGHSPGGVCFHFGDMVFVGDTLFAGSVGRTDLPGGNPSQLIDSIKNKLLSLDDSTVVLSGHGPQTTIGQERRTNPFISGNSW